MPASQHTPPAQLGTPLHTTLHAVPEQLTFLHVFTPVQVMAVWLARLATSVHVRAPPQSTAHRSAPQAIFCVQESGLLQTMTQDFASHWMGPVHEPAPAQSTLHSLPRHATPFVHEPAPMQFTVHELAAPQSMVEVHEPPPMQLTVHGTPAGQTIGPVHVPAAVHVTAHVPRWSHEPMPASAQTAGQTSAASAPGASAALASATFASSSAGPTPSRAVASEPSFARASAEGSTSPAPASDSVATLPPSHNSQLATGNVMTSNDHPERVTWNNGERPNPCCNRTNEVRGVGSVRVRPPRPKRERDAAKTIAPMRFQETPRPSRRSRLHLAWLLRRHGKGAGSV